MKTFADLVRDYRAYFQAGNRGERLRFHKMTSRAEAIEEAALCRLPNGKRHGHQCRIPGRVLKQAHRRLRKNLRRQYVDFHSLFLHVEQLIRGIHGIGELAVYDISTRIGAKLGLEPEFIYLHAGTRAGAKALGVGRGQQLIELSEVPAALRRLRPAEIEDCLCIYKDEIAKIARGKPVTVSKSRVGCGPRPGGC